MDSLSLLAEAKAILDGLAGPKYLNQDLYVRCGDCGYSTTTCDHASWKCRGRDARAWLENLKKPRTIETHSAASGEADFLIGLVRRFKDYARRRHGGEMCSYEAEARMTQALEDDLQTWIGRY